MTRGTADRRPGGCVGATNARDRADARGLARRAPQHRAAAWAVLLAVSCVPPAARAESAFAAYEGGDYSAAARGYLDAAERGDRLAAFNLAMMLFRGEAPGSREVAVAWLRRSAEQGMTQAQYNLGLLYENGTGVERSLAAATGWWERAAEQGHIEAQVATGTQYFLGRGAPHDEAVACRWYERAAASGHGGAQYLAASCYEHGYGGWPQDTERARYWYVQAARGGDVAAQAKARALAREP
jgi:TPR repeat protein